MVAIKPDPWLKPGDIDSEAPFGVIISEPVYINPDPNDASVEALRCVLELPHNIQKEYTFNKTSEKLWRGMHADETNAWVGKKGKFHLEDKMIRGNLKKVIYFMPL